MTSFASTTHELYLVLDRLSEKLRRYVELLQPITEAAEEGPLVDGIDALYMGSQDLCLLCFRFDTRSLSQSKRKWLVAIATEARVPVLDPGRLEHTDQSLFYDKYLLRYSLRVDGEESPHKALVSLGKLLELPEAEELSRGRRRFARTASPPVAMDAPAEEATTNATPSTGPLRAAGAATATEPAPPVLAYEAPLLGPAGRPKKNNFGKGTDKVSTVAVSRRASSSDEDTSVASGRARSPENAVGKARGKRRMNQRHATLPARPSSPNSAPGTCASDEQGESIFQAAATIQARYQRGDTWAHARLRNLTTKEIRLAASAAPSLHSKVRVSLSLGNLCCTVQGSVSEVVHAESSADGSTSFRVSLSYATPDERTGLIRLLKFAQSSKVAITPPPPRRETRFPLRWPVAVASEDQRFQAAALDISNKGLFLATTTLLRASHVHFALRTDRGESGIRGRARVAREVTELMARRRGLQRGYGLEIEQLNDQGQKPFNDFVERIVERSRRHILVAASGKRLQELSGSLRAAGYTVSSAHNLDGILALRNRSERPLDMAVIDSEGCPELASSHLLDRALHGCSATVLSVKGLHAGEARDRVDSQLGVGQ